MTHDSAVRTVVGLVPEIEKQGAAKALSDFATAEDLPAAQLEKLAQVYNTLRTISHVDNADESARGDTVPLVDVPRLVMDYATGAGREKAAAAPIHLSSHDPSKVDITRALRRELKPADLAKAAADASVKAPAASAEQEFMRQLSMDQVRDACLDLEIDLQTTMSKLAGEIFSAAPVVDDNLFLRDISEFEEAALRSSAPEAVKAAAAYLEKFAAPHRTKLVRFDYSQPLVKYAYEIPHTEGDKLSELADTVALFDIVKAAAVDDAAMRALLGMSPDGTGPAGPDNDLHGDGSPPNPELEEHQRRANENFQKLKEEEGDGDADDDHGKSGKKGGGGEKSKGDNKSSDFGTQLVGAVASPFALAGNAINSAASKADETFTKITSKERDNKAQREADTSVADIERAMRMRRMIGTDPVLKEADPRAVLEVYNSVVARNPELAGDMASLRLILREAVSYEGLTLDSQKLLTEMGRNSSQSKKENDETERKQYSAGGASNPIALGNSNKA